MQNLHSNELVFGGIHVMLVRDPLQLPSAMGYRLFDSPGESKNNIWAIFRKYFPKKNSKNEIHFQKSQRI